MTLSVLAGALTVALVVLLAAWWRRAPTRVRCPRCGEATTGVRHPGVREAGEALVRHRWCAACGWSGLGRAGPEWTPGQPSAHDSGFHWGERRFPKDFGFHFVRGGESRDPAEPPPGPPDHPSGFRFSPGGRSPTVWTFDWGSGTETEEPASDEGPEAATGARDPLERPGFRWRSPDDPRTGTWGFQWKEKEERGKDGPG